MKKIGLLIFLILILDQASKIWIKTHFMLGEEVYVFQWFSIFFIENNGAAWGTELDVHSGKLILTIFRLVAVVGIGYWMHLKVKNLGFNAFTAGIALVFSGALGNIIDSVFYGVVFDTSAYQIATLFAENPYGTLFHGKVVDMLYFPIFKTVFPAWLPFWGGQEFTFFNAIFNLADSAITIGVLLIVLFRKKDVASLPSQKQKTNIHA